MKEAEELKTIYYEDEINDDFADSKIEPIKIDKNYKYIHKNPIWNICSFIIYRIIFTLPTYVYTKIKFKLKIENKQALKNSKHYKQGYFVYGNHTQEIADTFFPTFINFPKRTYVIAHPNNVSIKGMKTINKMLGAIPIPGDIESGKSFLSTIQKYINNGKVIAIYPEAHVWPYYTEIRNFKSVSFKYPVQMNAPSYACTTTYQKICNKKGKEDNKCNDNNKNAKKNKDEFKIVIYIDGPFYPDKSLKVKQAQEKLRNEIYETMKKRSKKSNMKIIKYEKSNALNLKLKNDA